LTHLTWVLIIVLPVLEAINSLEIFFMIDQISAFSFIYVGYRVFEIGVNIAVLCAFKKILKNVARQSQNDKKHPENPEISGRDTSDHH
jgi:hypothetical protein